MSYNDYGDGGRGYDDRQGGGYGGGERGFDDRQGGGYSGGERGFDDRQGGGYGGAERGYDERQGGGYGGGGGGGGFDDRQGSGYGRQDPSEYGGGGRGSDNYYNQAAQSSYTESQGRNYGGGPGNNLNFQGGAHDDDDYSGAMSHAQQHSYGSGNDDMFSSVLGQLSGNRQRYQDEDFDEGRMVNAHQAMYVDGGEGRQHGSEDVGAGAAMQAMKMFTAGAGGGQQGGGQNALVGIAMGQASQLFDKQSSQGKLVSSRVFLLLFEFLQERISLRFLSISTAVEGLTDPICDRTPLQTSNLPL